MTSARYFAFRSSALTFRKTSAKRKSKDTVMAIPDLLYPSPKGIIRAFSVVIVTEICDLCQEI